jgi:soluble lytic murein transglycosylase-like protein
MPYQWTTREDGRVIVNGLLLWPNKVYARAIDRNVIGPWRSLAEEAGAVYGEPAAKVLAFIAAESLGNEKAHSYAGAYGLMQLMPQFFFPKGTDETYWTDPRNNVYAGTKHLADLRKQGLDIVKSASAYNVGHVVPDARQDWGYYAQPGYITRVVSGLNYIYERLDGAPGEGPELLPIVFGTAGVGAIGWYLYRYGVPKLPKI